MTIFKSKKNDLHYKDINDRQVKAIELVKQKGKITNKEYQKLNDISREMATIDLRKLVQIGIFVSSGSKGAGAFYTLK